MAINSLHAQQTIELRPGASCGKDVYLRSLSPSTNYGNHPDISAHAWTNGGNLVIVRGLFEFDLTQIPLGATIQGAYLSLYSYNSPGNGSHSTGALSNEATLRRVTGSWQENTVNWSNQPLTTGINEITLAASTASIQDYINIDVKDMVQDMINSPATSHGFLFSQVTEQIYRRMLFASSDNSNSNLHPKLVITLEDDIIPWSLGQDTILCYGDSLLLDASYTDGTYLWSNGLTDSSITITESGTYWVEVTGPCNESLIDSIHVEILLPIQLDLGTDTTLCEEDNLILNAYSQNATSYLWQDGSSGPIFTVNQSGLYWVEVSNACETIRDSIEINIGTFFPGLGSDTIICSGENILLDVFSVNGSYLWNDGSTNASLEVQESGIYWVEFSGPCNGILRDSIEVTIMDPVSIDLGPDTTLCPGEFFTIDLSELNQEIYWQDGSVSQHYTITDSGLYIAEVFVNGCVYSDSILVYLFEDEALDLGSDEVLCLDEILTFDFSYMNGEFLWQDGSTSPYYTINEPGDYWLTVSTNCGELTDSIRVDYEECDCYLEVPNSFSPNGDGLNDSFGPLMNCEFGENYHLMIFNRWGAKVFESFDPEMEWIGEDHAPGVYVYQLKAVIKKYNKLINRNGIINLIR